MTTDNDKLMEQFIEKATPKLLEALQTSISEQVNANLSGFKEHAERLLDQVQDGKRELEAAAKKQQEGAGQLQRLLEANPRDANAVHDALNPDPIQLTRVQARDPALYRRAKAQAERLGTTVQILRDE